MRLFVVLECSIHFIVFFVLEGSHTIVEEICKASFQTSQERENIALSCIPLLPDVKLKLLVLSFFP